MRRSILVIAALLSWQAAAAAQSLEPVRGFAFDRGLVDISEPYAPAGNPALLFQRQAFRFYAERQRANSNAYLMALSYPLSAKMGLGLAWHSWRDQDVRLFLAAIFNTSHTRQTFLFSLGASGRTQWGQQFEVTYEANRAALFAGPAAMAPPFDDDQSIRFVYRLGLYHAIAPKLALGLVTPPVFQYAYRTFLDSPRPTETRLHFGYEPFTRVWMPRVGLQWQAVDFFSLALSNRSLAGETDAQAAMQLQLLRNFHLSAAVTNGAEKNKNKKIFGVGGNLGGFDAFAAYEMRNRDFRLAVSFAPERAKELVAAGEAAPSTPVLYPYRLQHNEPAWLAQMAVTNKTSQPVEVAIKFSGPGLPSGKKGFILKGNEDTAVEVPVLAALQKLPAGNYHYRVELTAFQHGRQALQRQFAFEMKDAHDWSGDSRDLRYFVEADDLAILKTARSMLARHTANHRVLQPEAVAKSFYDFFRDSLHYVDDPRPLRARQDRVQYARETLQLKSGDCEDLTILMISLLASVGIRAAFIDATPPQSEAGHVFLLFDSGKGAAEAATDKDNLQRYIVRQNLGAPASLFVPLELTRLAQPFEQARLEALTLYQKLAIDAHGLAQGWVNIIDAN